MPGKYCCVCGNNKTKDPRISFHRIHSDPTQRTLWLQGFEMREEDVKYRICSRHFPDGDSSKATSTSLRKRFASPTKKGPRAKRAKQREQSKSLFGSPSLSPSSNRSATPTLSLEHLLFCLLFCRSLYGNQLTRLPEGLLNATTQLKQL